MSRSALGVSIVAAFALTASACGSNAGAGPSDAAAGSTGAGGQAGVVGGGQGGVTGGATSPTDGGVDSRADTPVDGPLAARAEKVCRDAIIAQCERRLACSGNGGSAADCATYADRCPSYYFNARSLRTVENVEACVPLLRQMTCTDIAMGLGSSCLLGGIGAAGAPCSAASECASGACSSAAPSCGTCTAPVALGAPCGGGCASGTVCHPTKRICVTPPVAVIHAQAGEPCTFAAEPPIGCEGDLICLPGSPGSSSGKCTALPKQGELCNESSLNIPSCGPWLGCGISTKTGDRQLTCGAPAPCGLITCDATTYCFESPTVQIMCRPYAAVGTPCSFNDPAGGTACAPGTRCIGAQGADKVYRGTCIALVELGAACDAKALCRDPFVCTAGHCARFDPAVCFAITDGGAGQ